MKNGRWLVLACLCLLLGACASLAPESAPCDCPTAGHATDTRGQLNEGYSMFYDAAAGLARIDLVFYAKVESDAFQQVVGEVADYNDELKTRLEKIAADFPAVKINLEPLPVMEQRAQDAASKDRLKDFLPVVGQTGAKYERTLLLTLSGILDHQRFLAQVMSQAEPDPALRQILQNAESRYVDLYDAVVKRLNAGYFKLDSYAPTPRS